MKNGLIIDKDGTKYWYLNDELHREDGPALEWVGGDQEWYLNGKLHRVDGPAEEWSDGSKFWYLHDKRHREGGPAIEWASGDKWWCLNNVQLVQPKEFETMEAWISELNNNEEYSYQFINDIEGLFGFIKNPSDKQRRLHQMRWVL